MENGREYWQRRAKEERAFADHCGNVGTAAIHRRLAILYATKAMDDAPTSEINPMPMAAQA